MKFLNYKRRPTDDEIIRINNDDISDIRKWLSKYDYNLYRKNAFEYELYVKDVYVTVLEDGDYVVLSKDIESGDLINTSIYQEGTFLNIFEGE